MLKTRFSSLFLAILLLFSLSMPALAIEPMEVLAGSAVLMSGETGEVLYDQNAYEKAFPASTTKMMTALLILEAMDEGALTIDQMIAIPQNAWEGLSSDASNQNLRFGETMSLLDLLYCLLLPSANEAANTLAITLSGDIPTFVDEMNTRARQLGCQTTHFMNPHGLHDEEHYSSPYDLALILQECLTHELFVEIVGTPAYTTAETELNAPREFYNTNGLVSAWYYSGYTYSSAIGGKTGYTPEAGRCLATAAQNGDNTLISVVLGAENVVEANGSTNCRYFSESTRLLKWGFVSFKQMTISPKDTPVAAMPITESDQTDEVLLYPKGSITRTLPVDFNVDDIDAEIKLDAESMEAPITAGQKLGTYTMSYEGEVYGVLDLLALNDVARAERLDEVREFTELNNVLDKLFNGEIVLTPAIIIMGVLAILAVGILITAIVLRINAQKRRRKASRGNYSGKR